VSPTHFLHCLWLRDLCGLCVVCCYAEYVILLLTMQCYDCRFYEVICSSSICPKLINVTQVLLSLLVFVRVVSVCWNLICCSHTDCICVSQVLFHFFLIFSLYLMLTLDVLSVRFLIIIILYFHFFVFYVFI